MRRPNALLSLCLAAAAALAAAPAEAAIHYQAVTTVEAEGQKPQKTQVEAWVDGASAKVLFSEAGVPTLEKGQYLLTSDGGETLYLVDPKEKTYAEWDLDALFAAFGAIMESVQPLVNLKIDNVKVARLGEEAGPAIHGLPTTHLTHRTEYDMTIKVFGMSRASHVETVQETWSTTELADVGLGVWLRNVPTTGFGDLDELVAAEMSTVRGFPLKTVSVSTTTGQKGKESTSKTTMEVTSLDRSATVPSGTFELPAGYTKTEMAAEEGGEGEEGEPANPLRGLFGGRGGGGA